MPLKGCHQATMKLKHISFILLLTVSFSCKKEKEKPAGNICFSRTSTQLKIENHTSKQFYFTAFGTSRLGLIDWLASCDNNGISANDSLSRDLSSFFDYSDNDSLVVYWWECSGNNPRLPVQYVMLAKDQTACK